MGYLDSTKFSLLCQESNYNIQVFLICTALWICNKCIHIFFLSSCYKALKFTIPKECKKEFFKGNYNFVVCVPWQKRWTSDGPRNNYLDINKKHISLNILVSVAHNAIYWNQVYNRRKLSLVIPQPLELFWIFRTPWKHRNIPIRWTQHAVLQRCVVGVDWSVGTFLFWIFIYSLLKSFRMLCVFG